MVTTTYRTSDSYQAAFYLMYGATLDTIEIRPLQDNKQAKQGYKKQAVFVLTEVPYWAIDLWHEHDIYGNISEYTRIREKLKRKLRRSLLTE